MAISDSAKEVLTQYALAIDVATSEVHKVLHAELGCANVDKVLGELIAVCLKQDKNQDILAALKAAL